MQPPEGNASNELLTVSLSDQYLTAEELFNQSRPTSKYYLLLVISTIIVSAGILLGSDTVVIGGVLVAPLLTPILFTGLALSAGRVASLPRMLMLLGRSALVVIGASFAMGFLLGSSSIALFDGDLSRIGILYLLVAVSSGVAGAFAWARKDVAEVLPGVALAVSLLPPLAAIGISIEQFDLVLLRFSLVIFIFNLIGILVGALVIFSLLKFYRTGDIIEKREREEAFKEDIERNTKEREKAVDN